jgi:DNA-binding FrmR family transcriptional regulator
MPAMKPEHRTSALNRLKTVRGHLDAVIGMVEDERYCPDIMRHTPDGSAAM